LAGSAGNWTDLGMVWQGFLEMEESKKTGLWFRDGGGQRKWVIPMDVLALQIFTHRDKAFRTKKCAKQKRWIEMSR